MTLEKQLQELSVYDIGFEIKQGFYHISIVFKDDWEILDPSNEYIHVETRNGVSHYIAKMDTASIEDMFNSIYLTINHNIEIEKKLELFAIKTNELREIFATEDYDTLKTIEFTYIKNKKKTTPSKKKTTKKKVKEKTEEQVIEQKQETPTTETEENKTEETPKEE